MKPNLDTLTEKTQNVRLSSAEKFDMLQDLRAYADTHSAKSPYQAAWFRSAFAVYASAFILVVATGATSFAAEQALPGDALYSIKTNVNEGVVRTLPLPASAKAKVEISMIDRRMGELEKMIVTNQDSPENVDIILKKIDDHKEEFDTHVLALNDDQVEGETDEIQAELETVVDAHIVVLEEITSEETTDTVDEPVVADEPEPVVTPSADVDAGDDMIADDFATASDPAATTMMMQAKMIEPAVMDAPVEARMEVRVVDPIVEEITEFSLTQIKPFSKTASGNGEIEPAAEAERESLMNRIFKNAEKKLNIDIQAFTETGADGTGLNN